MERVGIALKFRQQFHNHLVIVGGREDGGNLARAEGAVERVFDLLGGHAQGGRAVAIDIQRQLRAGDLQIAIDVRSGPDIAQHPLLKIAAER